jgi:hypothetical protein
MVRIDRFRFLIGPRSAQAPLICDFDEEEWMTKSERSPETKPVNDHDGESNQSIFAFGNREQHSVVLQGVAAYCSIHV